MGMRWWKSLASALTSNVKKVSPLVDPQSQTRKLADGSRVCKHLISDELKRRHYEDATTLYEVVKRGARVSNNGPMLGHRIKQSNGEEPFVWFRYNEIMDRSEIVARAFRKLNQPAGQETFIGVYSQNRVEWIIVEQATYSFNNVLVPIYDTLGIDASAFIINEANIQVVICDSAKKVSGLLEKKYACPSLKYIVLVDVYIPEELKNQAAQVNVQLFTFGELEEMGTTNDVNGNVLALQLPKSEDLCTICYTSGTTGAPKGVMLTHGNVVADCVVLDYFANSDINHEDVMISFLPLAHMYERVLQATFYMEGGSVGFFRGDLNLLADDIKTLRPTVIPVVPRLLNQFYDKVMAEVNKSTIKQLLFSVAMALKTHELENWIVRSNSWADKLVFKKVRDGFGGRVKLMLTGSAPISDQVLTFARCSLGCFVVEGYGQTECVAACTVTLEGDAVPGHVGVPFPCNSIKLVDAPELNYFAKDQIGEVCVRGFNVFRGYYKDPEQTKSVLDDEGWLHTGDIGKWTERGTLKIVDRKKHIFKLAQGEYVAPEKIENVYLRSRFVAQCFVYGESLKSCLVGIVVPDYEVLSHVAASHLGIKEKRTIEELCREPEVKKFILYDIQEVGKNAGLASFEQANDIFLCPEKFTVENDLLTPTLKAKRPKLKQHFQVQIDLMYEHLH